MEFLLDYAGFLAKTVTLVVSVLVVLWAIASMRRRVLQGTGQLRVSKLNDFFNQLQRGVERAVLDKAVKEENYELAMKIKEEIDSRTKDSEPLSRNALEE